MRSLIPAVSLLLLVACGKKETLPAPDTATAAAPATKAPEPAPAVMADTTQAEPAADTTPTANATAGDAPSTAAPDTTPTAEVAGDDLLVWTDSAGVRETLWLRGDEVVATRTEAVTFADGKLWALGERWRKVVLRPCDPETMEADPKARTTEVVLPRLVAKELGGAGELAIKDPTEGDTFDGELDASVALAGGIGGVIFATSGSSYYSCGAAHPSSDVNVGAFDLAKNEKAEIPSTDEQKAKLAEKLLADAKKNECLEEGETIEPTAPELVTLSFGNGRGIASLVASRGDLGHARQACEATAELEVPLDTALGFGPIDGRVLKVLATRPGGGAFGLATVPAALRDALLERFRAEPASFQPKP